MNVGDVLDRQRLVVCVGTGGVGKTTVAAAIALRAAMRGRRAMVLTIDPARALARSFGLDGLAPGGEPVPEAALAAAGLALPGRLHAGMLDQRHAWDGFIRRHARDEARAREILANPFYRELSTSFAGSTEYMALEELCRLSESGRHDLVVLDTPPAAHALDFLHAPERIDPLLDRRLIAAVTRPAGAMARWLMRRLDRAAGPGTVRDVVSFLVAVDALVDAAAARARSARALLTSPDTALVLVAGPRQLVLDETVALAARLPRLAAVVVNRVHRSPVIDRGAVDRGVSSLPQDAAAWVRAAWDDAAGEAALEGEYLARFRARLPAGLAHAELPEAAHDVHSLADLATIAAQL
jgi:anion-transporting  ArsA/GET3 family ATPase